MAERDKVVGLLYCALIGFLVKTWVCKLLIREGEGDGEGEGEGGAQEPIVIRLLHTRQILCNI